MKRSDEATILMQLSYLLPFFERTDEHEVHSTSQGYFVVSFQNINLSGTEYILTYWEIFFLLLIRSSSYSQWRIVFSSPNANKEGTLAIFSCFKGKSLLLLVGVSYDFLNYGRVTAEKREVYGQESPSVTADDDCEQESMLLYIQGLFFIAFEDLSQ